MRRSIGRFGVLAVAVLLLSGCLEVDVRLLASDAMAGRANGTAGSQKAQDVILGYLSGWTQGPVEGASGLDAYRMPIEGGTNLVGVLPGTTRADEYVVIGAHYDGLGSSCRGVSAADSICNGATDNATGAAIVIDVLRKTYYRADRPERSIVFAFWDREEDGLLGARAFVEDPPVPLEDVVAYVNLDIQGSNLRPSGRNLTLAVGAETGGPVLTEVVAAAAEASTLDTRLLSLVFGLGRSDHAVFANARVPTVFFTDATGPCYHTVDDEVEVVDFAKLEQQAATALRVTRALADRPDRPTFTSGLPLATFSDALSVQELVHALLQDLDTFAPPAQQVLLEKIATIDAVVAAGEGAFDAAAMTSMLLAINDVVGLLDDGECDGFLAGG